MTTDHAERTFYSEARLHGEDDSDTVGVASVYWDGYSVLLWLPDGSEPIMFGFTPSAFRELALLIARTTRAVAK